MIYQGFVFASSQYPANQEFLATFDTEVRQEVHRLQHHPSIAIWCSDNEIEDGVTPLDT